MLVHIVLLFIVGDNKSADMIGLRYGGKRTQRLTNGCDCHYKDSADPMHDCQWVKMSDLQELYRKATSESLSPAQRQRYVRALHRLSTHICDSAFYDVFFGENKFGICLATPVDMMHLFELGILTYVVDLFVASLTTTTRASADTLLEGLFQNLRSSEKGEHHRMNFSKGALSLSLLRACEWPGVVQSILVMLLTKEGKELCKGSFTEQDADLVIPSRDSHYPRFHQDPCQPIIPDVQAPKVRKRRKKKARIVEAQDEGDGITDDQGEVDQENTTGADDDNAGEDDVLGAETLAANIPGAAAKRLPCSHSQFVDLLESLLIFHAWYKDGGQVKATSTIPEKRKFTIKIRQLMIHIQELCPRTVGNKWQIQKFHQLLHVVPHAAAFGDIRNFDAGICEKHLGYWFKLQAKTSQKSGATTFTKQVADRLHFSCVLMKALQTNEGLYERSMGIAHWGSSAAALEIEPETSHSPPSPTAETRFIGKASITITNCGTDRNDHPIVTSKFHTTSTHHAEVHPSVLDYFAENWEQNCPEGSTSIQMWTDMKRYDSGRRTELSYRAHPNLRGDGPWYDFAYALIEDERRHTQTTNSYPCRIMGFHKHPITQAHMALVQCCDYQDNPNGTNGLRERLRKKLETKLCHRWSLEWKWKHILLEEASLGIPAQYRKVKIPRLVSIPITALHSRLMVVPESPELPSTYRHGMSTDVWLVDSSHDRGWSKHF